MDNIEIVERLVALEGKGSEMERRIHEVEETQKQIQSLTLSVEKMAISLEEMVKKQDKHDKRIEELENQPAQNWHLVSRTILTTVIGVVAGALATGIIMLISSNI